MKIIGCDIDGCMANFMEPFISFINEHYGRAITLPEVRRHYLDHIPELQMSRDELITYSHRFLDSAGRVTILPYVGAAEAIGLLAKQSSIVGITHRSAHLAEDTRTWMRTHIPPVADIHFVKGNKAHACKAVEAQVMIEDCLENAIDLGDAGIPTVLLDRPWNQEQHYPEYRGHDAYARIHRVADWTEAVAQVTALLTKNGRAVSQQDRRSRSA